MRGSFVKESCLGSGQIFALSPLGCTGFRGANRWLDVGVTFGSRVQRRAPGQKLAPTRDISLTTAHLLCDLVVGHKWGVPFQADQGGIAGALGIRKEKNSKEDTSLLPHFLARQR